MSIAPYIEPAPREWIAVLPKAAELAKAVANTEFVPKGLRGNPAAITAAILYGDEVGLKPMRALAHISVIDGRPSLSAEAQRSLILAAGHELWTEEATNTRVIVAGRRKDSDQTSRVTWTMDDAKRAGLAGKTNWRTYPRQMLMARASAELARVVFADAIGGLAATEEIEDGGAPTGDTQPEAPATRRRRTLAPVSAPAEETVPESGPPHSEAGAALADAVAPSDTEATGGQAPEDESAPTAGAGLPESPPVALMTDAQRPKLMALFNESGMGERRVRLAFATVMIGRKIESANDLTVEEASKLIDILERRNANLAAQAELIGEDALLQQLQDTLDAQETGEP